MPKKCHPITFISPKIKPDVSVIYVGKDTGCKHFTFFIEVVSNSDFIATVKKLYWALILQLLHIRSYNKTVTRVTGLVLPSKTKKSKIGLGTVEWNPKQFKFDAHLRYVTKEDLEDQLSIIEEQVESVRGGGEPVVEDVIFFASTLTSDDARTYLSTSNIQLTQSDTIRYFKVTGYCKPHMYTIDHFS